MSSCASALYFVNLKGDILLEKNYCNDVDRSVAEHFRTHILNSNESPVGVQPPVRTLGGSTFMYLRHSDIYLLAIARRNANAMLTFKFMSALVGLFQSYFEGDLCEASTKNNFVLMYELLDEVMDNGLPQITDPIVLKNFILQKSLKLDFLLDPDKKKEVAPNATLTVTGAVGWRREGIKYKKNEVFLDIIEQVNLLMSSNGAVLRSDVAGRIMMKCFLSDMPELRLGLNDKLEDATFHQCVNLSTFESQKVVTFVPPDGEFELMRYRASDGITLPFKVLPVCDAQGATRVEWNVTVKAAYSSKLHAASVVILVPVPDTTARATILVTAGKAKYDATKKALVWKISKFIGETEQTLRAEVNLVTTTREKKAWVKPPIAMTFQVPMFSASGLRVEYLKVVERKQGSGYKVEKWVRKVCKSGDYLTRT